MVADPSSHHLVDGGLGRAPLSLQVFPGIPKLLLRGRLKVRKIRFEMISLTDTALDAFISIILRRISR